MSNIYAKMGSEEVSIPLWTWDIDMSYMSWLIEILLGQVSTSPQQLPRIPSLTDSFGPGCPKVPETTWRRRRLGRNGYRLPDGILRLSTAKLAQIYIYRLYIYIYYIGYMLVIYIYRLYIYIVWHSTSPDSLQLLRFWVLDMSKHVQTAK